MAINVYPNFNRIINVYFLDELGNVKKSIICPTRGRKPNIEITGQAVTSELVTDFNIVIKNLYLDLNGDQYPRIRVEAGYEDETKVLEGTIFSMYQEQPAPEGSTVIQCQTGRIDTWLDKTVNLNFTENTTLETILSTVASKMSLTSKVSNSCKTLAIKEPLNATKRVSDLINELTRRFSEYKLVFTLRDNILYAWSETNKDTYQVHTLKLMSAPAQPGVGGDDGTYFTTLTAPWIPNLSVGDRLVYPAKQYIKFGGTVNSSSDGTNSICVTSINFHFGTVGKSNSMTVQGFGV